MRLGKNPNPNNGEREEFLHPLSANLPFTQCFESARQATLLRYNYSEDCDLYVVGDLYNNEVLTPVVIVVPRRRRLNRLIVSCRGRLCILERGEESERYDPTYLLPSLPEVEFTEVFDSALNLISKRFNSNIPFLGKINCALGLGKEKKLRGKINEIREFAKKIMREKESELRQIESKDLLSSFLRSGQSDEEFVVDVVICFILIRENQYHEFTLNQT
ncbi:hypothetical protein SASPL_129375 [Salvia splendens]|uniref:Uncharacterized protein n=1 Tax=Salvia splendens TaxID=180675 RepID=A0A8X8XD01_SALSN|nr:hypothetical protein SASPL_129375 [Salvia splendens]